MTIGIDIDDTITKTRETLEKEFGPYELIVQKIAEGKKEEYLEYMPKIFNNIAMYDNVLEVITLFKNKGYKLVSITARGSNNNPEMIPITDEFLKSNGFPFDKVVYAQEEKASACLDNTVDIFIDDNEIVLDEIAKYGIKTIRFSEHPVTSKHIVLHSWLEIRDYILGMGDKNE